MSTQFYKRYVPPAATEEEPAKISKRKRTEKAAPVVEEISEKQKSKKRKSEEDGDARAEKKQRRAEKKAKKELKAQEAARAAEVAKEAAEAAERQAVAEAESAANEQRKKEKKAKKEKKLLEEQLTLETAEAAKAAEKVEETPKKDKRKQRSPEPEDTTTTTTEAEDKEKTKKKKEKKEKVVAEKGDSAVAKSDTPKKTKEKKSGEAEDVATGHINILSKLRKSLARTAAVAAAAPEPSPAETPEVPEAEAVAPKGLQDLPQPAEKPELKPVSAFSSLPSWLQNPTTVSPSTTIPFTDIPNLSPKLVQRLQSQNLTSAFAVQTAVLPLLLKPSSSDILISAATGSGKTLAYVLPVIQALSTRIVTRLRAIIVVPTRELVQQVQATTTTLSASTGLKIGTAIGSRNLATEQALLVEPASEDEPASSKVDILITTPGRLVEHVASTPGFDLSFVQYLIIDEADRLLAQSFQEWVDIVIGGLHRQLASREVTHIGDFPISNLGLRPVKHEVQKIVLSATMTRDVGKLADLRLRNPKMVVVEDPPLPAEAGAVLEEGGNELEEQFSVPAGLTEYVTVVENPEYKPLMMLYLLIRKAIKTGILVFVKSNEGAARLAKLVSSVSEKSTTEKWRVELVTGEMEKKRREKTLKKFGRGEVDILICSDLISRGVDLPNVKHIINYDIPASVRAYIHRVGRTARAGAKGDAWTLINDKEARWFWNSVGKQVRRITPLEKVSVEMEPEGYGIRGVYEEVLYGEA